VFDELTSGLDPRAKASLLELLVDLKSQGMTVFFSSHHLREIEKICDSVTILHNGVLQCAGPLDSVLEDKESGTRLTLEELFNKVTMPEKEEVKS